MAEFKDKKEKMRHPIDGRSMVSVRTRLIQAEPDASESDASQSAGFMYRAYPDEAIDAAVKLADQAESFLKVLVDQRIRITAINIAFVGAILAYYTGGTEDNINIKVDFIPAAVLLTAISITFAIFTKQLGCSEVYYYDTARSARYIIRRHYKLEQIHWDANAEYQSNKSPFPRLFGMHAYKVFMYVNLLTPVAAILVLAVLAFH